MHDFFQLVSPQELLDHCRAFSPLSEELIDLAHARGRVLCQNLYSPEDLPPFARSTMDGFAVRARDTFGCSESEPALLSLQGEISMGEEGRQFSLEPGQCYRIWTGGELPRGADAVVMIEYTNLYSEDTVAVFRPLAPGDNIIAAGEDYTQHAQVLSQGQLLRPQELGLLAGLGRQKVAVHRRPRVAILSSGDELVPISQKPHGGKIRDINSTTLASLVEEAGGVSQLHGICGDDFEKLQKNCELALKEADVLLLSGGSSVGRRDFTHRVFSSFPDSTLLAHGVSVRPGKPTILAKRNNQALFGLPGHVASAMVVFYLFVRPLLRRFLGLPASHGLVPLQAITAVQIPSVIGREDYVRVRLLATADLTIPSVEPVYGKSGLLNSLIKADGLLPIARDCEGLDAGVPVWILLFPQIPNLNQN